MSAVRAEPVEARLFDRLRANGFMNITGRINKRCISALFSFVETGHFLLGGAMP